MYLKAGADPKAVNFQGLGVMHIAAQGDQILMLSFFKEKGFDPYALDSKGGTPLHWGAYLGCEISVLVLLSWGSDPNQPDYQGMTPLHLASISGNQRVVRKLLLKGAKPNVSDHRGITPMNIATDNNFDSVKKLLEKPDFLAFCGIKPPQRPNKNKRALLYLFVSLLIAGLFSNVFFVFGVKAWYLVLSGLEFLFLVAITNKDPGYLRKSQDDSLKSLCKNNEVYVVCAECVILRPPRSRHCQICERCVEKLDHHCPWINCCVGGKNLGLFYVFLWITFGLMISTAMLEVQAFFYWEFSPLFNVPEKVSSFVSAFWILVCFGFLGPLSVLVYVQTKNILSNTTTNERYTRSTRNLARIERSDSDTLVERGSVFRNITEMCCNVVPQRKQTNGMYSSREEFRYTFLREEYERDLNAPLLDR